MARPASDNTPQVWKFLRGKGLTPAQTAGVIGAMQQESGQGLNPAAVNPSSGATGIAQWLGGRKNAAVQSKQLGPQLRHLWSELQGPERGALQALKGAHSVEDATRAWLMKFERPGPGEQVLGRRVANARNVFNRLGSVGGDPNAAAGGRPRDTPTDGSTRTTTTTTPGVDNSQQRALVALNFLGSKNADVLDFASQIKQLQDIPGTTETKTVRTPGSSGSSGRSSDGSASASFSTPKLRSGVADFEGKKVAAWIAPALQYAREHGWKGQVNSGYRSFADQQRIYNSGVRPAAKPGTSNHEGTTFPRGAVDVSDAQTLARILARSPYGKRLKWAGAKDPVHFSHPHGGSY